MASAVIDIAFSLLLSYLVFHSSIVGAKPANHRFVSSKTNNSLEQQARRLIKSLKSFHEDDLNTIDNNSTRFVEKQFEFPFLDASDSSIRNIRHHAGYFWLPHAKRARMFYLFFESRYNKDDPVVLWLTGGPGCSGELALFYENGPFHITDDLYLVWNAYGWDKMFFDRHQEFTKNHFFITGESYAGHYIPVLASLIHQKNEKNKGNPIKLEGFAIGNGFTNPEIQYSAYPDFALDMGLISESDHERIVAEIPDCKSSIKACGTGGENACVTALKECNTIFQDILNIDIDVNYYDIRDECKPFQHSCYDFSAMKKFLKRKPVLAALGVGEHKFVECSITVYNAMKADWMKNLDVGIPSLLERGIKVLIYVGDQDLICNWVGNSRWVHAMEWSQKESFRTAPTIPLVVGNAEVGDLKNSGPLTFLKIYDAGHMVPMDQPEAAFHMLKRWMKGTLVDHSE